MSEAQQPLKYAPLYYLAVLLFAVAGGLSFVFFDFVTLLLGLLAAAALVTLFRLSSPVWAALVACAYPVAAYLVTSSGSVAVLALAVPVVAALMAYGLRSGEGRASLTATAAAVLAVFFTLFITWRLWRLSVAQGAADFPAFLTEYLDALRDELVKAMQLVFEMVVTMLLEEGIEYPTPSLEVIEAAVGQAMALAPAALFLLLLALSLALTYLVQLVSLMLKNEMLFSRQNAEYRLGAVTAIVYLFSLLCSVFYTDFSSVYSTVTVSLVTVLGPALAFASLLGVLRFLAFMFHQASRGIFHAAIWYTLFFICVLSYIEYFLPIFAIWQSVHIIKSTFFPSAGRGGKARKG